MSPFDNLIILFFLFGIILFSINQSQKNQTSNNESYFLAGKKMHWIVAMFSIVATETSVITFVGIPALSFVDHNWSVLQIVLGFILGRVIVSHFFISMYYKNGIVSIYEVIGQKFGVNVQRAASVTFLITRLIADGIRFFATAKIVQIATGWDLQLSIIIIGIITIFYSSIGGLRTILWIDGFQFFIYLSCGVITIIYIIFYQSVDTGTILNQVNIFSEWINFSNTNSFFIMLFGGALISIGSHGVDYLMVQRVLSTKNISSAKKAMLGSGIFVFVQFCVFLLVGSLIFETGFDPLEQGDVFAEYIKYEIPIGLKGLMIAGALSAAMSSLSSSINAMASSTVIDVLGDKSFDKSIKISVFWGVLITVFCLLIKFDKETPIFILALQIASFTYGGLISLFVLSKLKTTLHSFSVLCGYISSIIILLIMYFYSVHFIYFIGIALFSNFVIIIVVNFYYSLLKNRVDN